MKKLKIITEFPVAYNSPDHIVPVGTKNDNSTDSEYIMEVENFFKNEKINIMDIGCAGGQLAVDFYNRGHLSVGIEGSDYNIKHKQFNWPTYHEKVLWTADLTKPFKMVDENNNRVFFDLISAWEVVEHIHPNDLDNFFDNILSQLKPDGIFISSVNMGPDDRIDKNGNVIHLHQSVFPEKHWKEKILSKRIVESYPFVNKVRNSLNSFYMTMKREKDVK
jgi:2-polyprenyl-3-methyl-5-hydroxy-6-metoxy-1,4-benzoquinol methylase